MPIPYIPDPNTGDEQEPKECREYEGQEAPAFDLLTTEDPLLPLTIEGEPSLPASSETQLPPEARSEANGGPLGCCLGVTIGLFFSVFIGVVGFGGDLAYGLSFVLPFPALTNIRIATGLIAVIGAVLCGYFGWKIGKRIYREYEPPVIKERSKKRKTRPKAKRPRLDPYKNF